MTEATSLRTPSALSPHTSHTTLLELPPELFLNSICKELDAPSLFATSHVCKRFCTVLPPQKMSEDLGSMAIKLGYLELLKWLVETFEYPLNRQTACSDAAQLGDWAILAWFIEKGYPFKGNAYQSAAEHNQLHILKSLKSKFPMELNESVFNSAARGGGWDTLHWLTEQNCPLDKETACGNAAEGGHLDVMKWLRAQDQCSFGDPFRFAHIFAGSLRFAARGGRLEILEIFLPLIGREANSFYSEAHLPSAAIGAAESGNIETLEWLIEHTDISWMLRNRGNVSANQAALEQAASAAARSGNLRFLQWIKNENCPASFGIFRAIQAAEGGHVHILEWMVQKCGLRLDEDRGFYTVFISRAESNGNLNVLKWVKEKGYPLIFRHWRLDSVNDCKIFKWIIAERPDMTQASASQSAAICERAAARGDLRTLKWFYQQGFGIGKNACMEVANKSQDFEMIEWLNTIDEHPIIDPLSRQNR